MPSRRTTTSRTSTRTSTFPSECWRRSRASQKWPLLNAARRHGLARGANADRGTRRREARAELRARPVRPRGNPEAVAADARRAHRRDPAPVPASLPLEHDRDSDDWVSHEIEREPGDDTAAAPSTDRDERGWQVPLEPNPRHCDERLPAVPARREDRAVDVEVVRFRPGEKESNECVEVAAQPERDDELARRGPALHLEDEEARNVANDPAAHDMGDRRAGALVFLPVAGEIRERDALGVERARVVSDLPVDRGVAPRIRRAERRVARSDPAASSAGERGSRVGIGRADDDEAPWRDPRHGGLRRDADTVDALAWRQLGDRERYSDPGHDGCERRPPHGGRG